MRAAKPCLVGAMWIVGCASAPPPEPNATAAPAAPPSAEPAPTSNAEAAAPPRKPRKPFEVYSTCADVVTVAFAEDPKSPKVDRRPIAPSATIEGPRNEDGNQTVWLLDDKGEPIAKVNVTRGMKRVEIGRSCRTLDAR